jgi:hypothetical protein
MGSRTRAVSVTHAEMLYGFEAHTFYVEASAATRGQAKALVAYEECEPFTDVRCRRVWLELRCVSEEEAADLWLDGWLPDVPVWVACRSDTPGAVAWWELTTPVAYGRRLA